MLNIDFISVIIPTIYRTKLGLNRLKSSLIGFSKQTLSNAKFEIIIVDDGHYIKLDKEIKSWNLSLDIKYFPKVHSGMCSSFKKGIEVARGDYILLAVDDNIPHHNLLKEHILILQKEPNSLVVGREYHVRKYKDQSNVVNYKNNRGKNFEKSLPLTYITENFDLLIKEGEIIDKYIEIEDILSSPTDPYKVKNSWMTMRVGNHSLSKKLLNDIGGIDTNFDPSGWYMDLELGYRLIKNKVKIIFNPKAIMVHISHNHSEETLRDEESNHRYFYKKHPELAIALLPFFFKSNLLISQYTKLIKRIQRYL